MKKIQYIIEMEKRKIRKCRIIYGKNNAMFKNKYKVIKLK